MVKSEPIQNKRTLYGRRVGRPLKPKQKEVLEALLPTIGIDTSVLSEDHTLDPAALFKTAPENLIFEIGFGNGEHLFGLMKQEPQAHYIGAEPYINGMATFLRNIETQHQNHIRVWMEDALKIAKSLKPEKVDTLYVLNPDPWPKTRHHKRRIISQANLDVFATILKPKGQLIMSTDVDNLAEWMVTEASNHPAFTWEARSKEDWQKPPDGWIQTRYEQKGTDLGRKETYLIFAREEDKASKT